MLIINAVIYRLLIYLELQFIYFIFFYSKVVPWAHLPLLEKSSFMDETKTYRHRQWFLLKRWLMHRKHPAMSTDQCSHQKIVIYT